MDKIGLVTSHKSIAKSIHDQRGPLAGEAKASIVNLGIDAAAGKAVRARGQGRASKLKMRLAAAARKACRLRKLQKPLGRKTTIFFAAGPVAGGIFGTEVYGVSDRELLALRRMGMSTIKPRAQGRSLSVISLLEGDPPWRAAVAPIIRWSREIWILQTHSFEWSLSWAEIRSGWEH
eukprot:5166868-Pyramimonas_sp.AAC.1